MREDKDIELLSEEVQEVLGAVPHWILRCGIFVISIVVMLLLIGSWFFKYPDTIAATMTLTGTTPPAGIVAKTSGLLKELNVGDNQMVKQGEYLAVIDNPAKTHDMLLLKISLQQLIQHPDSSFEFFNQQLQLGSVQSTYTSFVRCLYNYQKFIKLNYYPQKIASIQKRIESYRQSYQSALRQQKITEQQFGIAGKRYERDSLLNQRSVLSPQEMDDARNTFLQSNLSMESSNSMLENLQIQIAQLEETLLDTDQQYMDNQSSLESDLLTAGTQLMNEINTWEMTYVLMAPIKGKVTFAGYWSNNQHIMAGETVFTVIPETTLALLGKASLPIVRSGKVKVGQIVNIHFLNYPDEEFGMVRGIVKNISLVPINDNYTVEITLPNGLMTTYKKKLPFSQEMTANIEIITEDLRLLERFFLPVKKILNNHF